MKPRRRFLIAGAALLASIAAFDFKAAAVARDEEAKARALEHVERTLRLERARWQAAQEERSLELELGGKSVSAQSSEIAGSSARPMTDSGSDAPVTNVDKSDPLVNQEIESRWFRADLFASYSPLYTQLGLSPAQIDRFEDLMVEHWHRTEDIAAIRAEQKLDEADAAIARLIAEETGRLNEALRGFLGIGAFERYGDYKRMLPAREVIHTLAAQLFYSETPLDATQANRLTEIMARGSPAYVRGDEVEVTNLDWGAVQRQAQEILSPAQLAAFHRARQAQQAVAQFEKAIAVATQALPDELKIRPRAGVVKGK